MSDVDGLLLSVGVTIGLGSLAAIFRPEMLVKESRRNRDARLRGLDAGAPENYFEERRELEAYPPRFNPSHRTLRLLGLAGFALGILCIFEGLTK